MVDDELFFLQDWFRSQCDGDWEHETGIRIETLDNPGWRMRVNLVGTPLEGETQDWVRHDESDDVWLFWRSDGLEFDAACGPRDLHRSIAAFRSFSARVQRK